MTENFNSKEELYLYWLLQAYKTLRRESFEDGLTDDECGSNINQVLAFAGVAPDSAEANRLLNKPADWFVGKLTPEMIADLEIITCGEAK